MGQRLGVPADTEGDFGPKGPTIATGGQGYCTGTRGTVYFDGTRLTAPDGQTAIKLSGTVTIPGKPPGSDQALGSFVAVTPGSAGNLPVGTELAWQQPPSGSDAKVVLTAPLRGALDGETDRSLLDRTLARTQKPPKGRQRGGRPPELGRVRRGGCSAPTSPRSAGAWTPSTS